MDDWESEDFEPAVPAIKKETKGQWDDEDADEDNVKESWEDEDAPELPKQPPPAENAASKAGAKVAGKKSKMSTVKSKEATAAVKDDVLADPVAEKLRQQRIVEEADFKSTTELFAKKGDEKTLDNFIPKSESDFLEYAELASHKLRSYEKSYHYVNLLKAVLRHSVIALKGPEVKEVASSLLAIANEKIKSERETTSKKKQGSKKKQLHVDKPDDEAVVGVYDALDDNEYDFMGRPDQVQIKVLGLRLVVT